MLIPAKDSLVVMILDLLLKKYKAKSKINGLDVTKWIKIIFAIPVFTFYWVDIL